MRHLKYPLWNFTVFSEEYTASVLRIEIKERGDVGKSTLVFTF
jgi:hypothetical protein